MTLKGRRRYLPLIALASLSMLSGCPPANDRAEKQAFLSLWNSLHNEGDAVRMAHRFLPYYDNLVAMLPEYEYSVAWIVGSQGSWFAAAKLEPYLRSTDGPRQVSVATLVAILSGGYSEEAMALLRNPPSP